MSEISSMHRLADLYFLQADKYGNNTYYIKNRLAVDNYMVEICEFFKMAFSKILDLAEKGKTVIGCYFLLP